MRSIRGAAVDGMPPQTEYYAQTGFKDEISVLKEGENNAYSRTQLPLTDRIQYFRKKFLYLGGLEFDLFVFLPRQAKQYCEVELPHQKCILCFDVDLKCEAADLDHAAEHEARHVKIRRSWSCIRFHCDEF